MPKNSPGDFTLLLSEASNPEAFAELMRLAYSELHRISAYLFRQEPPGHILQPTALVHELYIRLWNDRPDHYENRAHFFCVAVTNMRRILVEQIRHGRAKKRGGDMQKVPLDQVNLAGPEIPDYIALDEMIEQLDRYDPELARVVEMRVFGGLSSAEIARVLNIAESTARKRWALAQAWLRRNANGVNEQIQ